MPVVAPVMALAVVELETATAPERPVELSEELRVLAGAFVVLLLVAARYFWTHDEKGAAVACTLLSGVVLFEGVLGFRVAD